MSEHTIKIVAVAAMSENRVIGKAGSIPWRVKGDFKFWTDMSTGRPIIMGRKTFIDMPPGFQRRETVFVVTRDENFTVDNPDVTVVHSLDEAFEKARAHCFENDKHTIVIGGGSEIYRQAMDQTDIIYLSHIHTTVENGDAFFPELNDNIWTQDGDEQHFDKEDGDTASWSVRKYKRA